MDSDVHVKADTTSTSLRVITSTGKLYDNGVVPLNYVESITYTSVGLSNSSAKAYGVTFVDGNGTFTTSPAILYLEDPIAGVQKTIVFDTTAAAANTLDVNLAPATVIGTSGDFYIAFSSLATMTQSITLIGLSSVLWGVCNVMSTIAFGAADGIRSSTAARTS